jgi:hypothetical protein
MNNPWSQIIKPDSEVNVRLIDHKHPLHLYWGVDVKNNYLFMYEGDLEGMPSKNELPRLLGIQIFITSDSNKSKLIILLQDKSDWEIFNTLCNDLIRATAKAKYPSDSASIILRRLKKWQEFLKKERRGLLSIEEIKGLVGELLFLSGPLATTFGLEKAISFWKGPEDAPQDFAIYDDSIEVKCQSGESKPTVRISSLEQLNHQLPNGYLVVFTLASASGEEVGSFNLNTIIKSIKDKLVLLKDDSKERFEDLIHLSGYIENDGYNEYNFTKVSDGCYKIAGDFPRILPNSISKGILSITYSIQLEACQPFKSKPTWWKNDL